MIKVKLLNIDNITKKIEIKGHAKYAEYGKDIVCSGVSSIVTTTVNACIRFNEDYIKYESSENLFLIEVLVINEVTTILISNMICMIKELSEDYPKNINIKEENL